jgi:hypothetical protein
MVWSISIPWERPGILQLPDGEMLRRGEDKARQELEVCVKLGDQLSQVPLLSLPPPPLPSLPPLPSAPSLPSLPSLTSAQQQAMLRHDILILIEMLAQQQLAQSQQQLAQAQQLLAQARCDARCEAAGAAAAAAQSQRQLQKLQSLRGMCCCSCKMRCCCSSGRSSSCCPPGPRCPPLLSPPLSLLPLLLFVMHRMAGVVVEYPTRFLGGLRYEPLSELLDINLIPAPGVQLPQLSAKST